MCVEGGGIFMSGVCLFVFVREYIYVCFCEWVMFVCVLGLRVFVFVREHIFVLFMFVCVWGLRAFVFVREHFFFFL